MRQPVLLVFACALTVRLIVLIQFREMNPLFENPVVDAAQYDSLARNFLRLGKWPEEGAFFQPPAYPFFLAVVYKIFGESYTWIRVVQAVMGSLSCAMVCLMGARLHARRTGLAAGLATAFYGPLIYFDLDLLAPVLIVFWSVLGLLLLITSLQDNKKILMFAAGLCLGTALISWPVIGLACAATALSLCWSFRTAPRKAAALVILLSAGVLIPVMPLFLHNVLHGKWVLISTNGGVNFYIGNNPDWQETVSMRPGYPWEKIMNLPHRTYGAEQVAQMGSSELFFKEAKQFIFSHPTAYLRNQLLKLYQIGFGYEIMRNTDLYFFKQFSTVLDNLMCNAKWLKFPFGVLFPFALTGVFFSLKSARRENRYILGYLAAVIAGLLLFFITARYRVILVPFLSLYAAMGFWELTRRLRGGLRNAFPLLALLAALFLGFNLDLFGQQKLFDSGIYQGQASFTMGRVNIERNRPGVALPWLIKSTQTDPAYPDAWVDLGRARYALGDVMGAVEATRTAARVAPGYPLPYYNLGRLYDFDLSSPKEAIRYYRLYLSTANAYYETAFRGPNRENFVRQRVAELAAQNNGLGKQ